jgi:Putative DNA-binding domain
MSLSDLQTRVRNAVVASAYEAVTPMLTGGRNPAMRLAIHRRHYHASLVEALRGRFPATAWLIGDAALTTAAALYVRAHPPSVFCIAEFGCTFPGFLASRPGLSALTYLEAFATLEWEVGRVSVAVSAPAVAPAWLHHQDPAAFGGLTLDLQPGLAYLRINTSVDDVFRVFLSGVPPSQSTLVDGPYWLEVRGARGEFDITRLAVGDWHFRRALAGGHTIEAAAGAALDADDQSDPGAALMHLLATGLVISHARPAQESQS